MEALSTLNTSNRDWVTAVGEDFIGTHRGNLIARGAGGRLEVQHELGRSCSVRRIMNDGNRCIIATANGLIVLDSDEIRRLVRDVRVLALTCLGGSRCLSQKGIHQGSARPVKYTGLTTMYLGVFSCVTGCRIACVPDGRPLCVAFLEHMERNVQNRGQVKSHHEVEAMASIVCGDSELLLVGGPCGKASYRPWGALKGQDFTTLQAREGSKVNLREITCIAAEAGRVAIGDEGGTVTTWDVRKGTLEYKQSIQKTKAEITCLSWKANGCLLVGAKDGSVWIWSQGQPSLSLPKGQDELNLGITR